MWGSFFNGCRRGSNAATRGFREIKYYVPAPKVPKVTVAMQKHHIQSVRLVRVYRKYIHDIGVHRYFGDTIVVKKGRWDRDTKTYSYNDLPTGKFD